MIRLEWLLPYLSFSQTHEGVPVFRSFTSSTLNCLSNTTVTGYKRRESCGKSVTGDNRCQDTFPCGFQGYPKSQHLQTTLTPRYQKGSWWPHNRPVYGPAIRSRTEMYNFVFRTNNCPFIVDEIGDSRKVKGQGWERRETILKGVTYFITRLWLYWSRRFWDKVKRPVVDKTNGHRRGMVNLI